uniref:Uncharacterized protein n=1 Tax=Rangifer tarandus platyrhynchus TaxID=3082113 RepID=A0ACB0DPT8_RANTA|nr:unnamed protein product [Rangifer tarandus platyrhynchus]
MHNEPGEPTHDEPCEPTHDEPQSCRRGLSRPVGEGQVTLPLYGRQTRPQSQGVTRAGRGRNKGREAEDGSGHGSSRIRGCERRQACDYRGQDGAHLKDDGWSRRAGGKWGGTAGEALVCNLGVR